MSESILEEAQRIIHGARNQAYGHPRDNFAAIAALWNAYMDHAVADALESQDVANMMILMKVARINNGVYHRDSVTDIAGYAGTIERLQEPEHVTLKEHLDGLYNAPLARQWDSLADVPIAVRVSDGSSMWRHTGESWEWSYGPDDDIEWVEASSGLHNYRGPFTEILGPPPLDGRNT